MKILKRNISAKDGSGHVLLVPETPEDLWHVYNLLQAGDSVRCTTFRKVIQESSTGSTSSSKKRIMLTIQVQKVDFDPDSLELRLAGTTTSEHANVRLGSHHTLTIELHTTFSIDKQRWDQIFLDRLQQASHPEQQADLAAVICQMGLAHLCLITGSLTITKARIDMNIPKKRTGSSKQPKAVQKFFHAIYQAILRHVDFTKIKCILLASPGFVKDDLFQYLCQQSLLQQSSNSGSITMTTENGTVIDQSMALQKNKHKFILCKSSSGHKHSLVEEVLVDPSIMNQIVETKVAKEVSILQLFMKMMDSDPDRAVYGFQHVRMAQESLAIQSLLITDALFRNSKSVQIRQTHVQLVEDVRASGGQVFLFSSMHFSGQQLQHLSGIAAILRFPMPNLDDLENDDDNQYYNNDSDDDDDDHQNDPTHETNRQLREDIEGMNL